MVTRYPDEEVNPDSKAGESTKSKIIFSNKMTCPVTLMRWLRIALILCFIAIQKLLFGLMLLSCA